MLFLAAGTTDTKFRRSTGVTTANSTNIRNTVELGDQLSLPMSLKALVNMTSIQSLCRGIYKKGGMPRRDPPPTGNSAGAASAARSCSGWPRLTTTYLLHHHCSTCTMHHVLVPCNDRCGAIAEIWWRGFRARTLVSAALAPSTSFSSDCFSGSLPPHSVCVTQLKLTLSSRLHC